MTRFDEKNSGVDKTLIAMFLKMTPEQRLLLHDDAVRTIRELKDAFRQKNDFRLRPERHT